MMRVFTFSLAFSLALAPLAAHAGSARLDPTEGGWYDTRLPVPVMHLEGSIEEVARAHGKLLRRHPEGVAVLSHYASLVRDRLAESPGLAKFPAGPAVAGWVYRHFIRNFMLDRVPERYQAAYSAFASAAGIAEDDVLEALALPDAALRVVSLLHGAEHSPRLAPHLGCTSVIWNSEPAAVLHGRNLDYDGVGFWDRNQVILHVVPQEGLAYVAVTALGIPAPGITAFNESGLTLAVHELTLDDTQSSGTPMPVISAEVIRNARSIDEAIAVIRAFPRAAGWAYVLSLGTDRAVVETSASEIAVRRSSEPFFYQTNHVSSPALANRQIFYSPGSWLDSFERAERMGALARSIPRDWATPEKIAGLLGDHANQRVAGGTIAKLDNVQSVIMDASHRRLWVGTAKNSDAPNQGTYVEYRWSDLRAADPPEVTGAEVAAFPRERLGEQGAKLRALLRRALEREVAGDSAAAGRALEQYALESRAGRKGASALPGSWPGLFLGVWRGMIATARSRDAGARSAWERFLSRLDLGLKDPDLANDRPASRHRISLGRLFRGRLLDLLGRRNEALFEYYVARRTAPFSRVRDASSRGLRRSYTSEEAAALSVDWSGVDLFGY